MLTEAKDGMASLLPQYKSRILKRITHDLLTTEPKRFHNVTFYAIQEQYKSKQKMFKELLYMDSNCF